MPKRKLPCGVTHLDRQTFLDYIESLRETYHADAYHLLHFNCESSLLRLPSTALTRDARLFAGNTFTNDVLGFLNGGSIPACAFTRALSLLRAAADRLCPADIRNQPSELMATPFGQQMRPVIEQMFVGRRTPSAGDTVNNLMPQLGIQPPPETAREPDLQSVASNLQIITSAASLRSLLAGSPAVALMFTSPTCPPCNAIRPHFEALARQHSRPRERIEFALVGTHVGEGLTIAQSSEFGGPVTATPSFAFFHRGHRIAQCRGADRAQLEAEIDSLARAAYPPHPHARLAVPALRKLAGQLDPVTFTPFPPLAKLTAKLEASCPGSSALPKATVDTLTKRVPSYLAGLPVPSGSAPLPVGLLDAWLPATLTAAQSLPVVDRFPVVDLVRLALARDADRLAAAPSFVAWLPSLVSHLAHDLDLDDPDRPYLLTALRVVSNALVSSRMTARLFAPDCLPDVTRLVLRALLDPQDPKMRSAGAGTAWSVVARVYAARVGDGGLSVEVGEQHALGGQGGEEWEAEMASAVLEALAKQTESLDGGGSLVIFLGLVLAYASGSPVYRLAATLGLLLFQSPYTDEICALLEVLDVGATLGRKREMCKSGDAVADLLRDLEAVVRV